MKRTEYEKGLKVKVKEMTAPYSKPQRDYGVGICLSEAPYELPGNQGLYAIVKFEEVTVEKALIRLEVVKSQ